MLSEHKKLTEKQRLRELPELERPWTVRLKFRKTGSLQYISHLDLQRTFNRVIVRACLPVWYTKGFNPHAKLVFSTPLSIGAQSTCEYLDLRLDREISCDGVRERLNRELTDELYITDAYIPQSDFSDIAWSSYMLEIHTFGANESLAERAQELFSKSPLMLVKKTKSGEKEIDIVPMIKTLDAAYDSTADTLKIQCMLSATSTKYLNPEMLVTALKQNLGILGGNAAEERYAIMRTGLYREDLTSFE